MLAAFLSCGANAGTPERRRASTASLRLTDNGTRVIEGAGECVGAEDDARRLCRNGVARNRLARVRQRGAGVVREGVSVSTFLG